MIYPVDSAIQPLNNWGQVVIYPKNSAIQRLNNLSLMGEALTYKQNSLHQFFKEIYGEFVFGYWG